MRELKITTSFTNPSKNLSRYFNEVLRQDTLTPEEEAELAFKAFKGDKDAKEKIIKANLKFVISVAKMYTSEKAPLEDMISEGNKGLIEAADKFDPTNGFKFISYAVWHIRKNMLLYLNNLSRTIRIPTNLVYEIRKYQDMEEVFMMRNSRNPTIEEMVELMEEYGDNKLSPAAKEFLKNKVFSVPLEGSKSDSDDDKLSPIDWISNEDNIENDVNRKFLRKVIDEIMEILTEDEELYIKMHYGFLEENVEPMTMSQIGLRVNKSAEAVRYIVKRAERKMQITARKLRINNQII